MKRFLMTLLFSLMLALGTAHAIDFEVGYELDLNAGQAVYIYATEDFRVATLPWNSGLWFSPSVELELRVPFTGFVQLQLLADTYPGTVSVRARYSFPNGPAYARVGLLFEF